MAKLKFCGFWVGVIQLVNRYDKNWITAAEDEATPYNKPGSLAEFITSHSLFYRYRPLKKLYIERGDDFTDTWEPLKVAGLINNIPQYAKTKEEADKIHADLRMLREELAPFLSLEDYRARIVPALAYDGLFDESLPAFPVEDQSLQDEATPVEDRPTTTTMSQPSPYEYLVTERPTDSTLPQNRPHSLLPDTGTPVALSSPSIPPFAARVDGLTEPESTQRLSRSATITSTPAPRTPQIPLTNAVAGGNRRGKGRAWAAQLA